MSHFILQFINKKRNSWLLTGWEDKKEAPVNASGEGYDSSTATTATPTLTRRNGETDASSMSNVAQGQEEVNGVDNAKLAPYRDAVAQIMSQAGRDKSYLSKAENALVDIIKDANYASQGQFDLMKVVTGTQDQLTHEEMVAAQKIANDALGKVHEAQAAEQFVNAIRKVMDLYQNKEIDRERAWELLHSIDGGIQAKNLEGNKALGDYFADSLKLLGQGSVEEEQNLQDAQFDSMESHEGTGFHEAFHVAHDMVLTDKEKALLDTHIGDEEAQVDHYAAWVEARKKGRGTAWGKLWQKIQDFARKMQAILTRTENVHNVLRKIESGDVWSRTAEDLQQENKKFAVTNKEITAETRVPVIDVTGQRMVNVDDKEEKKKIAQSLMGQTFKIIGSNGIGRISSMKMGEHFVNSSNHKLRKDPSRRRALSIAEKVLNNAVYVEKHDDVRHHTDVKYIELFTRIRDGNTTSTFRIVAREGDKNTGEYEIKDVKFYDIIKEEDSSTVATVPNSRKGISTANTSTTDVHQQNESSSDTVSVAELLQGVKDR